MFEVNEEVRIREDLTMEQTGIDDVFLQAYAGKKAIIKSKLYNSAENKHNYLLSIDSSYFFWQEDWLCKIDEDDDLDEWIKQAKKYLRSKG